MTAGLLAVQHDDFVIADIASEEVQNDIEHEQNLQKNVYDFEVRPELCPSQRDWQREDKENAAQGDQDVPHNMERAYRVDHPQVVPNPVLLHLILCVHNNVASCICQEQELIRHHVGCFVLSAIGHSHKLIEVNFAILVFVNRGHEIFHDLFRTG